MGRRKQIVPTCYQRNSLVCVVHHDGQVIADRPVLAAEHEVAEQAWPGDDKPRLAGRSPAGLFEA